MRELVVAGVRAGLQNWRPWGRGDVTPLLLVLGASVALVRPDYSGWLKFLVVLGLLASLAWCLQNLYTRRFKQPSTPIAGIRRLLCAWGLVVLFFVVLGSLFFVVLISTLYAVASAGQGFDPKQVATWAPAIDARGRVVASVVFGLGLLVLGWAAMRLWLSSATTVVEARIAMLSTWPFTRGRVIPMTIARLVLSLPALVLLIPVVEAWPRASPAFRPVLGGAVALIITLAWLPMQVGAAAEFYRRRVLPPEPAL